MKARSKFTLERAMKAQRGKYKYNYTLSSTSALDAVWLVNAKPRPLYPLETPGTQDGF
jgi:hypothetical protein